MPDEDRLEPGPKRDLTLAIHALYEDAGLPGTRTISDAIRIRDDLTDTVSHEAVRRILLGTRSRWSKVAGLVSQLIVWSVANPRPDPQLALKRIHELWLAAEKSLGSSPEAPLTSFSSQIDQQYGGQPADIESSETLLSAKPDNSVVSTSERNGQPLIRWESRMGSIEIFDRQMATQIIRDMGQSNE